MNHEITKGRITIKTGIRTELRRVRGWQIEAFSIHTCEVWIGGKCFRTDAESLEQAIELVRTTAIDLGLRP